MTIPEKVGPYEIVAPLGAGGMGQVYRAHDPRLNRDVALKMLPAEFSSDPLRKQRFEQEAKAVAALNHPGIVSLFDVGDGWMVTELVEGENLRQNRFTVRQVIDIGAQIADALAAAHEAGIAHRDLKPENVILTHDGRTKILDFGLAKVIDIKYDANGHATPPENISTITSPGSPLGTPGYMAPEQVRGQASDHRSDIFSLGVILYEMLAGRAPFEAESAIEVMHAIVHDDPAPLPPEVPEGLRAIIARCLQKKPAQRFQSARDLAFALRELADTEPVGTKPAATGVKRPWWPYVILAGALASLAGAYLWLKPAPPSPLDNYHFRPFAITRSQEHSGVWSPDGKSIAYIEQTVDGARLMVQAVDGTAPSELVDQISSQPGQIAWSPDSTRVYFLGVGPQFSGVSAVSRAGGAPERVIANANFFHISPDGKNLAIWRGKPNGGGTVQYSVWISSPPGAEPKEYTPKPFAVPTPFTPVTLRFSRDNSKIFLSMYTDEGAQTWLLPFPAGSGEPHRIFKNVNWSRPVLASWMPDNKHIVLSGNPAPQVNEQLWLADVENETMTRIMALPSAAQATPSVSPDGTQILFSQIQRDRDILRFPVDGSTPTPILSTDIPEYGPSWSPTGDQLAFVTQRSGNDELWIRSAEGNWDRPLVTLKEFPTLQTLVSPIFSPDGTRIAYTALLVGGGRRRSLAISSVGGGDPTVISDGYGATWSPDGSTIAFLWLKSDGTLPVATLRVGSDQPPTEIFPNRATAAPEWSPSGEWIAVPTFRGVELTKPDSSQQKLMPGMNGAALGWSPDSKTIYGLTFQSPHPTLSAMDVATGKVREIAKYDVNFPPFLENLYTGSIRISMAPDGKSFAAATATAQADLWILDGFGAR